MHLSITIQFWFGHHIKFIHSIILKSCEDGHAHLRPLLVIMASVAKHKLHVVHERILVVITLGADVVLDGAQVHRLLDDLVVVWIVFFRGLDHEEVTEASSAPGFSCLSHCSIQRLHSVLFGVLLMAVTTSI